MPASQLPSHITISPDVLYQNLEGKAVLLDLRDESYHSLDDVGTEIWKLLAQHEEVDRIVAGMKTLYQVDDTTLRVDLAAFFAKLEEAGLIQFSPEFLTA